MQPREIFGVTVRVCGLISLLYFLGSGVAVLFGAFAFPFLIRMILWLALSLYLLRGAPHIVRFAYPD